MLVNLGLVCVVVGAALAAILFRCVFIRLQAGSYGICGYGFGVCCYRSRLGGDPASVFICLSASRLLRYLWVWVWSVLL